MRERSFARTLLQAAHSVTRLALPHSVTRLALNLATLHIHILCTPFVIHEDPKTIAPSPRQPTATPNPSPAAIRVAWRAEAVSPKPADCVFTHQSPSLCRYPVVHTMSHVNWHFS